MGSFLPLLQMANLLRVRVLLDDDLVLSLFKPMQLSDQFEFGLLLVLDGLLDNIRDGPLLLDVMRLFTNLLDPFLVERYLGGDLEVLHGSRVDTSVGLLEG